MAKEDFCFTYYDGDATRDMQHMDRLCRGAYNDLIIMQRKVKNGRLTMNHIKAVLGGDFEKCWYSLEIILKRDGDFFYIEWVEKSIELMRKSSAKQKQKAEKRWAGQNNQENAAAQENNAAADKNNTVGLPLENENGIENRVKRKEGTGENQSGDLPMGHLMFLKFTSINPTYPQRPSNDYPAITEFANFIAAQLGFQNQIAFFDPDERIAVMELWEKIAQWYSDVGENNSLDYLQKYKLQKIYSEVKNGNTKNTPSSSLGKKSGGFGMLAKLQQELNSGNNSS